MSSVIIPSIETVTVVETLGSTVLLTNSVVNISDADINLADYYTKGETDGLLATKADVIHMHVVNDISDFSTTVLNGGVF